MLKSVEVSLGAVRGQGWRTGLGELRRGRGSRQTNADLGDARACVVF